MLGASIFMFVKQRRVMRKIKSNKVIPVVFAVGSIKREGIA